MRKGDKMTQYKSKVELQKKILAAEEFADNIKGMQVHRMNSMWYDCLLYTSPSPRD